MFISFSVRSGASWTEIVNRNRDRIFTESSKNERSRVDRVQLLVVSLCFNQFKSSFLSVDLNKVLEEVNESSEVYPSLAIVTESLDHISFKIFNGHLLRGPFLN